MNLTAATHARQVSREGVWEADIPDGWQQGRGAYGGLVLGLLTRAMTVPGRPLRSLTGGLCAPTPVGRVEMHVATLRAGTGVTFVESRMRADGGVTGYAQGVFGRGRGNLAGWSVVPAPDAPPVAAVPELERVSFAPAFTQHWHYHLIGPPPFSGQSPEVRGWLRARDPGVGRDAAFLVAAADAWWPAAFSAWTRPTAMATVAFTLQVLVDPATIDPSAPLLHVGRAEVLADGYSAERRELWTASGELVCINQQTFAVF